MTRIGITSSIDGPDALDHPDVLPYTRAVRSTGAEAVALPNAPARVTELLDSVDGVLLSGGRDVDPGRYGEAQQPQTQLVAPERDAFEIALTLEAKRRGVPLLGICRGMQVANVALGGSLVQDLPAYFGDNYVIHHKQTTEDGLDRTGYGIDHYVMVEPGSALARLLGDDEIATNSMHHQGIGRVAAGLRASASTHDGVIEGLEPEFEHPFFFLVEWHPEELMDDPSRNLFEGFAAAAQAARLARAALS